MEKQTIYMTMRDGSIETEQGYVYSIVYDKGSVDVGLIYRRPYWFATHLLSGMDCTPYSDPGGYEKRWKNRDLLLEALQGIDLHSIASKEYVVKYIKALNTLKLRQKP